MATIPGELRQEAKAAHRRETLLFIALPAGLALLLIVILLVVAMALSTRGQVSIISDIFLTVLMLCPAAVCAFPLAMGLLLAAFAMNRVHSWTDIKLDALIRISTDLSARLNTLFDRLARVGINIGVRAAPIEQKVFSVFDRPERRNGVDGHESHTPKRS